MPIREEGDGQDAFKPCRIEDYSFPSDLTVDEYYKMLMKNASTKCSYCGADLDSKGRCTGKNSSKGGSKGKSDSNKQDDKEGCGVHDFWESFEKNEISKAAIDHILRQAKKMTSDAQWGMLPHNLREMIDESLKPKFSSIPWHVLLRRFIEASGKVEISWTKKKKSKRYKKRPGVKLKPRHRIHVAIDTSGSINEKQLAVFVTELEFANKTADITVIECDAEIQRVYNFEKTISYVEGRGGTSFIPPIEWCKEKQVRSLIYLTDGYGDAPDSIDFMQICWVLTKDGEKPADYGKVINLPV
mgnify:CR=1 FL=1